MLAIARFQILLSIQTLVPTVCYLLFLLDCFALALIPLYLCHMRILTVAALGWALPGHCASSLVTLLDLSVFHEAPIFFIIEGHKLWRSVSFPFAAWSGFLPVYQPTLSSVGHDVPLHCALHILLSRQSVSQFFCLAKI